MRLRQFVPPKICLSCQICCRFPRARCVWQPRLSKEEIAFFKRPLFKGKIQKGIIKLKSRQKVYHCSFFNPSANHCRIYKWRPFDCRLYPFVLTREKGKVILAAHLVCPFILRTSHSRRFKRYGGYLKRLFASQKVRRFLEDNPSLIGDYQDYRQELILLFPITLS